MKYIDAEKLRSVLQNTINSMKEKDAKGERYDAFLNGKLSICEELLGCIDSLQQEQPKPSGYDKALLEVKSLVDKLYDEASIGLNEYDSGLYNGIAETCMKLRGFIKARLDSDEQPEVDLEKEMDSYFNEHFSPCVDGTLISERTGMEIDGNDYDDIARHFYELGFNARKEE